MAPRWLWICCIAVMASRGFAQDLEQSDDFASMPISVSGGELDDLPPLIEIHQVLVTLEQEIPLIQTHSESPRHVAEKKNLLERMQRSTGTWTSGHPRHRLLDALHGFKMYHHRQAEEIERLRGLYKKVSKQQQSLLEKHVHYSHKFGLIHKLLEKNQELCDRVVDSALKYYEIEASELEGHMRQMESEGKKADKIAVSQSLKHIIRDWTADGGAYERDQCFRCITDTMNHLFPERSDSSSDVKVLIPGAGLGRLGRDIAELKGFEVTVNEWSMFMNVAYRFLEAHGHPMHSETVHPFVDSWSHQSTSGNMQRPLTFPDAPLDASQVLLVEGDFTTVFNNDPTAQYDVIVTYFFIDTARNLVTYFETIKRLLKPSGYWINLGPLLYGTAPFVQLSLEEILTVVEKGLGLKLIDVGGDQCGETTFPGRPVRWMEAIYGFDDRALTKNAYKAQFWVAQK